MPAPAYDIIGDIHGHAIELKELLHKLGYAHSNGAYRHPNRKVLFLGDYIDKGDHIREVLQIVRAMVDQGQAIALMGNHEFNALCWSVEDGKGGYLRPHTEEKEEQHEATLRQFKDLPEEWNDHLTWFRTLPLFHEEPEFRAVHACWDDRHIALLRDELRSGLTDEFLSRSVVKGSALHVAVEEILKGKELSVPGDLTFEDKYGHSRNEVRIRWWEDLIGKSFAEPSVLPAPKFAHIPVTDRRHADGFIYPEHERPVFFGHYWLQHPHPAIMRSNICCLDFSVAKAGALMAYRFDGKQFLDASKLISVQAVSRVRADP